MGNNDVLITSIERLGTITDNWNLLREILKTIVEQLPASQTKVKK